MRQLSWMVLTLSASLVRAKASSMGRYSSSPAMAGDASSSSLPTEAAVAAVAEATLTVASHSLGG
jgi:hypothetical protein